MENTKNSSSNNNNQLEPSKSSREGRSVSACISPTRIKDKRDDSMPATAAAAAGGKSVFKVEDS